MDADAVPERVLIAAPHGRDAQLVEQLLTREGFSCHGCSRLEELGSVLEAGAGAVLLSQEALSPAMVSLLVRTLDAQPPWSSLPVILMLDPPRSRQTDDVGVMQSLGLERKLIVLERPMRPQTLVTVVRAALRARRQQYAVRNLLGQLEELTVTLEQKVAQRTRRIRELSRQLADAEQQERHRLAQLLHDHLQQLLVAAKMRLSMAAGRQGDALQAIVDQVQDLLVQSVDATRSLAVQLSPPVLEQQGLSAALRWLVQRMGQEYGLAVHLHVEADLPDLSQGERSFVFQATRELLFNIVKHAQVAEADLWVRREWGRLEVTVEDAGAGALPERMFHGAQGPQTGFGLASIRQRLELLGGELRVQTAPGRGCHITIDLPLEPEAD